MGKGLLGRVLALAFLVTGSLLAALLTPRAAQAGEVKASIKAASAWESEGAKYAQYDVSVTNGTQQTVDSWYVEVATGGVSFTVYNSWNCSWTLSADGGTLKLAPNADWERTIAPGASQGFGLIVKSDAGTHWDTCTVRYTVGQTEASAASSGDGGTPATGTTDLPAVDAAVTSGAGPLRVVGTRLCDASGSPACLQGLSLHGLGFGTDFTRYVNQAAFQTLRDDWGANLVRLPVYTENYGGWCTAEGNGVEGNRAILRRVVDNGVTHATNLGMYAIIDWHILSDGNPQTHQADAVAFFSEMSARYKNHTNVIYEICNEPNGGTSWEQIRAYATAVIPVIRANDPDALIICGTPTWSQDVDQVASAPLPYDNVMYACHFYAATHGDFLRGKVRKALAAGTPVFISESSICNADGNGGADYASANAWASLIRDNGLSYVEWSLSNKAEAASAISSSCAKTSGWEASDLTDTGRWYRNLMRSLRDDTEAAKLPEGSVAMYRLYNPNSGEHFYTASTAERDYVVAAGWRYEGVGWAAPTSSGSPVYRLYNPNAGDHHYTLSAVERDHLVSVGWRFEGVGWYSDDARSVPLYRQYNPNAVAGAHNFTTSRAENDWLVGLGWRAEGIAWYGVR